MKFLVVAILLNWLIGLSWTIDNSFKSCLQDIVKTPFEYDYRINLDQAFKKIQDLKYKYRNQLQTKILGHYDGEPIYRIDMPGTGAAERKKVVITAGVHGNEAIGVEVLLELIEQLAFDSKLRNAYDFVFLPALNPGGLKNYKRAMNNKIDLQDTWVKGKEGKVAKMVIKSLEGEKIDMVMDLHEVVSQDKFFAIRTKNNKDDLIKKAFAQIPTQYALKSASETYPLPLYSISNSKEVVYILNGPGDAVSMNVGALKNYFNEVLNVEHSYAIEAPKRMKLSEKREIYIKLVKSFLNKLSEK